ncbi:hypothetical protein RHSIM_Rhsim09G0113600 [Rhododendron simsii]|uniref:Uncharacterized protein n=1 Tax=Rhododendron simsii TaxID=118357 RepID=A0A834GIM9_RHOSS|nr:hypothetical protein RHSIM_Rhsim09G0113600 [Rhododendron simsii]
MIAADASSPLLLYYSSSAPRCRTSSTSPPLLQLRSFTAATTSPHFLRLQNAIPFPAYTAAAPPLHHRCLCCLPPLSLHIITAAAPLHQLRYMSPLLLITSTTSSPPLCLHCLSVSERIPSEPLHPPHTIRWKTFTVRHRRSHPSVTTSGFHITVAEDNTATASPRRRLTTPLLSTTDATQQQQPAVDQTKLSVGDQKSQTTSRSPGTPPPPSKNTTKHGQNGIFRV